MEINQEAQKILSKYRLSKYGAPGEISIMCMNRAAGKEVGEKIVKADPSLSYKIEPHVTELFTDSCLVVLTKFLPVHFNHDKGVDDMLNNLM